MPEYLTPGVYVEETSFRAKSIEGVSTSTTGFVGPTRKGPITGTPELITNIGDFERVYGGPTNLDFAGESTVNYMAHAIRSYFANGGQRVYVSRVFRAAAGSNGFPDPVVLPDGAAPADRVEFIARFPGQAANGRVVTQQVSTEVNGDATLDRAPIGSLLQLADDSFHVKVADGWQPALPDGTTQGNILTLNVSLEDAGGNAKDFEDLGFDPTHRRWIGHVLAENPSRRIDSLENLFAVRIGEDVDGPTLHAALFPGGQAAPIAFSSANDGAQPTEATYRGSADAPSGLAALELLEDISIVAAPGSSAYNSAQAVANLLITHAERPRAYRIAVLDTPPDQAISEARTVRSRIDSTHAALYYPWVVVSNPELRPGDESQPREIALPPSGFVCGIYARNDVQRGVHKSPANEIVRGALRFESDVSFAQQGVLNPNGINALRFFPGRGYRVWGARTASSDPEWKYVNVRRYFLFLEQSIDRGTQWAVFENNGPRLWANVRETIESFLYDQWFSGALLGANPEEAYFVRCDRSTMTQNDLDNGRLVCEIGVAVLKPAEFVIFRIGQKTIDAS